ncbi:MAG TPA: class I SAM-dependent methyltransferase [Solirubrobacteraceae bacterium]|jgi:2-polyprenyl-3-methyl-5-hydroxy-6-metoxy-1,4-benzoquinol methylase
MSDQAPTTAAAESQVPERFDPATMQGELLEAEHLARYRWAAGLAPGRRVLDAGCGTAYGSAMLADAGALEVTGIDLDLDVLDSVRPAMPSGVTLEQGDLTALQYPDDRFDLVVCFEVIEHVEDPAAALDELCRVLSPDGVLALSSPNRDVYPPGNPHHVHEYTPSELAHELASRFAFTRLERQHTWITSGVLDDDRFAVADGEELGPEIRVLKLAANEPGTELYTVALAGQQELPGSDGILELTTPVELRRWDALWHEQALLLRHQEELLAANQKLLDEHAELFSAHERAFAEQAVLEGQLRHEIEELRSQLTNTESKLARMPGLDAQLKELLKVNDEVLAHNHELQLRLVAHEDLAARYTVLVESTSWRLTSPLRRFVAVLRRFTK